MSMISYDDNDIQSMALCVWREARGEGDIGMQAVGWVIRNRAANWYKGASGSIHSVVYGRNQFTSMSVPTDPEFNLIPDADDPQYVYCLNTCPDILSGALTDVTNGAYYYCNPKESTSGWFSENISGPDGKGMPNHPLVAAIGNQLFYS